MVELRSLTQIFRNSEEITFNDKSRIILMSDCHRGDGSWADTFLKNQNLFFAALSYYFRKKYTYIELGDGDELWENDKISDIIEVHSDAFWLLSKFYNEDRLHMIFGNHDIIKQNNNFNKIDLQYDSKDRVKRYIDLYKKMKFHEGLVLKHEVTGKKIFLVHGHQVDYFNDKLWKLSRFLVKYLWKPLEIFGLNDPTSTAKNYKKIESVGKKLTKWTIKNKQMLVAGHTHRPVFPKVGEHLYFNDGSCVHPRCITGIEIFEGYIMLVKWSVKTEYDGTLYIDRDILSGPTKLSDYLK